MMSIFNIESSYSLGTSDSINHDTTNPGTSHSHYQVNHSNINPCSPSITNSSKSQDINPGTADRDYKLTLFDYHDRPENFHRTCGVFALGSLKGIMVLKGIETDEENDSETEMGMKVEREIETGLETAIETETTTITSTRQILRLPDLWTHCYKLKDVLIFQWRGCEQPKSNLDRFLKRKAAGIQGTSSGPGQQHPLRETGTCRLEILSHDTVRLEWFDNNGSELRSHGGKPMGKSYEGKRLGSSVALNGMARGNVRPMETRDGHGRNWEELGHR